MPHVIVKMKQGRTVEQKSGLTNQIVKAVTKSLGVGPEAVSIELIDVNPDEEIAEKLREAIRTCARESDDFDSFELPSSSEDAKHARWRQVIWSWRKEDLYGMKILHIRDTLVRVTLQFSEIRKRAIDKSHWESP